MITITKQLAAILAGISKDRRPEMAAHHSRLDELKDLLMDHPASQPPIYIVVLLLEIDIQLETP